MNTPNTMTNEQINIKIAELCGWRQVHKPGLPGLIVGHAPKGHADDKTHYPIEPAGDWWELPDYTTNLNACHEFEKTLDALTEWHGEEHHANAEEAYMGALSQVCKGQNRWSDDWQVIRATARQRCEAFLRVHGQWEEEA